MGFGTVLQRTCIGFAIFSDGQASNGIFHSSLFVLHLSCPSTYLYTKIEQKQGQKATFFNNEFNEICRRPTDCKEVIYRIFSSQVPSDSFHIFVLIRLIRCYVLICLSL